MRHDRSRRKGQTAPPAAPLSRLREYWASEVAALSPAATHSPGTVTGQDLNGG